MKNDIVSRIRTEIEDFKDSYKNHPMRYPSQLDNRPVGCPYKCRMIKELQELEENELYFAFHLGLIGNGNKKGSIIEDCRDFEKYF